MENGDSNLDRWVDERLASLDAPEWRPDTGRGLSRLRRKGRIVRRRRWGLSAAGCLALAASLFTIPGCQAATCKVKSENLAERLWKTVFRESDATPPRTKPPAVSPPPESVIAPAEPPKPAAPAAPIRADGNFKESGSPLAPVTCEIYTDYECPACARFYAEAMPRLVAEYVETGKVRVLHRDFPLDVHRFSRLAARYANAAGQAGHYNPAVTQIFRTQSAWGLTGDIDTPLAAVLAPEVMEKVRRSIKSDLRLDDSVSADMEQARLDQLRQTPSVVIVSKGQRQTIPYRDYQTLKALLDATLARR